VARSEEGGGKVTYQEEHVARSEEGGKAILQEEHVARSDPTAVEKTAFVAVELFSGQAVVAAAFEDKSINLPKRWIMTHECEPI
jgi:hypothetical protein